MLVINPEYKKDWDDIATFHHDLMKKYQKLSRECAYHGKWNTKRYQEISRRLQLHNGELLKCYEIYQHKTVQAYAKWLFSHLEDDLIPLVPDATTFKTIEDVKSVWHELHVMKNKQEEERRLAEFQEQVALYRQATFESVNPKRRWWMRMKIFG